MSDLEPDYLRCLDAAIESLTAYTSGLVPNFGEMTDEAFVVWADTNVLGLLEVSSNLLGWVAHLQDRSLEEVRADLAAMVAERRFLSGE